MALAVLRRKSGLCLMIIVVGKGEKSINHNSWVSSLSNQADGNAIKFRMWRNGIEDHRLQRNRWVQWRNVESQPLQATLSVSGWWLYYFHKLVCFLLWHNLVLDMTVLTMRERHPQELVPERDGRDAIERTQWHPTKIQEQWLKSRQALWKPEWERCQVKMTLSLLLQV